MMAPEAKLPSPVYCNAPACGNMRHVITPYYTVAPFHAFTPPRRGSPVSTFEGIAGPLRASRSLGRSRQIAALVANAKVGSYQVKSATVVWSACSACPELTSSVVSILGGSFHTDSKLSKKSYAKSPRQAARRMPQTG